ncbi:hypothetical protein CDL15_Pgr018795 [Punica granatum]|uniref:Uncharacterized protein n=1 Tax=Punica granatum TaxID=22663 RepID=A0A218VV74_PUNGR|nr:hypothetical protein CDL15_Pgr018795 [Punica granatum]
MRVRSRCNQKIQNTEIQSGQAADLPREVEEEKNTTTGKKKKKKKKAKTRRKGPGGRVRGFIDLLRGWLEIPAELPDP